LRVAYIANCRDFYNHQFLSFEEGHYPVDLSKDPAGYRQSLVAPILHDGKNLEDNNREDGK